jgi:hypothetical protein
VPHHLVLPVKSEGEAASGNINGTNKPQWENKFFLMKKNIKFVNRNGNIRLINLNGNIKFSTATGT